MSDRYARQIAVPEIGASGQARLDRASVLIVGAGGLGSVVLQYSSAAGVGRLTVVDHDRVEESNLHRQPLYRVRDLGAWKAVAARDALLETNPQTCVEPVCERLTPANVARLVAAADVVVDAADSFAVTYTLSDECRRTCKTLVSASVLGLTGYAGAFCGGGPSLSRCIPGDAVTSGYMRRIGSARNRSGCRWRSAGADNAILYSGVAALALGSADLDGLSQPAFRRLSFTGAQEPNAQATLGFICASQVSPTDVVIDLRTSAEISAMPFASTLRTAVDGVANLKPQLPRSCRVVLCCRSGSRAWRAARLLQAQGYESLALLALG